LTRESGIKLKTDRASRVVLDDCNARGIKGENGVKNISLQKKECWEKAKFIFPF
jgi:hypothetical protein